MTSILKNTTINGTGYLSSISAPTASRNTPVTTIIQWTNTGSQSYSVLAGPTPTLSNTSWTCPAGVNNIEVLVVAGGGGGGGSYGGGGGAGGLIYNGSFSVTPSTQYTVTVGAGGAAGARNNTSPGNYGGVGGNSVFGSLTAIGGGGGGAYSGQSTVASSQNGGSGGGGGSVGSGNNLNGGTGTAGQGNNGGAALNTGGYGAGGGGGAGGPPGPMNVRDVGQGGGIGLNFSISGTPTWYAGGGGGAGYSPTLNSATYGAGGLGGGGRGGTFNPNSDGVAGTASTGGGGGGATDISGGNAGAGGSGVVIIRYNILSDNTQPEASIRYNSEVNSLETNNAGTASWVSQDPTRNFAGHNLITYSQIFGSGHSLSNVTVPTANNLAPDGTSTASFVAEDSTASAYHEFYASFATASSTSGTYTYSIYAKAGTRNWIALRLGNSSTSSYSFIDLSTGTVGTVSGHTNVTVTAVGNGWYRCSATRDTTLGSGTQFAGVRLASDGSTFIYSGQGSSYGVYLWGSQVELKSSPGPYVYTNGVASPIPTSLNGYCTHTYTTVGASGFTPAYSGVVELLIVAGGGAGGYEGGGGAGGLIYNTSYPVLAGNCYPVVVGAGGVGTTDQGSGTNTANNGLNSSFGGVVAIGGGGAGKYSGSRTGAAGGSGGGAASGGSSARSGFIQGQGNTGGLGVTSGAGGGGGAGGPGGDGVAADGGRGGSGLLISISGTPTWYAGGGGGAAGSGTQGSGGLGGGGNGVLNGTAGSGTANTGGGGGGFWQGGSGTAGSGGSGIVIVRYRYN